jgi:FdhE protein
VIESTYLVASLPRRRGGTEARASIVVESCLRSRIAALVEAEQALVDELTLRGALIEVLDRADLDVGELRLPADVVRARLGAGRPLLDRLDLPVPPAASALIERLTMAKLAGPTARQHAEAILAALREHRLHAEQLVGEALVGHDDHLAALAESARLPPVAVGSVADLAARSVLAAVARRLRPALALATWDRGYCPVCGGRPIFAEQIPSDPPSSQAGERDAPTRLRCGRCATAWAHPLLRCIDCQPGWLVPLEGPDPAAVDGWTLLGCDACPDYLKVAGSARSERLADLLLDDLETRQLDRAARALGRERRTGSGCRLEHGEPAGEELDDD